MSIQNVKGTLDARDGEAAKFVDPNRPLSKMEYLLRNLTLSLAGQYLADQSGLSEQLSPTAWIDFSARKLDDLTGFKSWIPGVGAAEVPNSRNTMSSRPAVKQPAPESSAATTTPEATADVKFVDATNTNVQTWGETISNLYTDNAPESMQHGVTKIDSLVTDGASRAYSLVEGNLHWAGPVAGVVVTASVANFLFNNRIKNPHVRYGASLVTGFALTAAVGYGMNHFGCPNPLTLKKTADVALSLPIYTGLAQFAANRGLFNLVNRAVFYAGEVCSKSLNFGGRTAQLTAPKKKDQ